MIVTLQILVPQYLETEEVIRPLLDSIEIQQNVDLRNEVGVIIVNDGSDVLLSESFLSRYSYDIQYIRREHGGVSAARNAALDAATAEYVMFCDADDMFYNACGLWIIFREIANGGFDSLVSCFVEETRHHETHEVLYVNHEVDSTFVHGKVHRRQYLLDNNIRWNEALTIHEDSYFNTLCQRLSGNVKYCPTSFYLWRWRDESVCRHDPKYILKTYGNMLDSNTALVRQFVSRGKNDIAMSIVTSMIYDAYFTMNKDEWINQENKAYRDATERRFREYYLEFKPIFHGVPKEQRIAIAAGLRQRMYSEGLLMETETFDHWIRHIEEDL